MTEGPASRRRPAWWLLAQHPLRRAERIAAMERVHLAARRAAAAAEVRGAPDAAASGPEGASGAGPVGAARAPRRVAQQRRGCDGPTDRQEGPWVALCGVSLLASG